MKFGIRLSATPTDKQIRRLASRCHLLPDSLKVVERHGAHHVVLLFQDDDHPNDGVQAMELLASLLAFKARGLLQLSQEPETGVILEDDGPFVPFTPTNEWLSVLETEDANIS